MRFQLALQRNGKYKMLPMDYQYYIGAWIYKTIGRADRDFARFLHTEGYRDGNKNFKLFTYSPINLGKPVVWKEKSLFEISNSTVYLKVGFHLSDAAEKFIVGLFNNQQLYIGDRFNGIDFTVSHIERLPDQEIRETMFYQALSPVVVSLKNENDKYARYLSPLDPEYGELLKNNSRNKHNIVPNTIKLDDDITFSFKPEASVKSKLITIKPYSKQQSKVRGFIFGFSLTAPCALHQLILNAGLGEKNATGFGWVEVIPDLTGF